MTSANGSAMDLFLLEDEEKVSDSASLSHRGFEPFIGAGTYSAGLPAKIAGNRLLPINGPRASEQSSPSLADRIRAGDPAAERELIDRFSREVRVILRNAGADRSAVDDLHQKTFRIALEKIRSGELRYAAGLGGFLASLARNLATKHFRRGRRLTANVPAALKSLHSPELGALDRIVAGEQARCVRQVLEELGTKRDREILRRFYLSSEAKEKICEDWGLSSLQFNRLLYRARERYRELYENSVEQDRCVVS